MKISQNGIDLIKGFEGCKLVIYLDPVGVPTGGYGHTKGLKANMVGQKITQSIADGWLKDDLAAFEKKVDKYSKYDWTQNEFDALVSFAFNIGSIDQLTQMGTRSKAQIADSMLKYIKAGGKVLPGLVRRRQAEHDLFVLQSKSVEDIAKEVIDGKWGVGEDRKKRLANAGYNYREVQNIVNILLKK